MLLQCFNALFTISFLLKVKALLFDWAWCNAYIRGVILQLSVSQSPGELCDTRQLVTQRSAAVRPWWLWYRNESSWYKKRQVWCIFRRFMQTWTDEHQYIIILWISLTLFFQHHTYPLPWQIHLQKSDHPEKIIRHDQLAPLTPIID